MAEKIQSGGITIEQQTGEDLLLVEAYGDGGFRLLGRRVEGAMLVDGEGFYPVSATTVAELAPESFARILADAVRPDILLIGTGARMQLLPSAIRTYLESQGIGFDIMDTGAAARTFNVLTIEGRRVSALLLPVE